jgi:hypothetical protein
MGFLARLDVLAQQAPLEEEARLLLFSQQMGVLQLRLLFSSSIQRAF